MRTLVVMLLAICTPSFAQESNPLIGNWKLVSQQAIVDGAAPQHTFGSNPNGYMILTREGRMIGIGTAENRQSGSSDFDSTGSHCISQCLPTVANIGSKATTSSPSSMSHGMRWNGTEQRRHFRFEGEKLILETPPAPSLLQPGKTVVARVVWEERNNGCRTRRFP